LTRQLAGTTSSPGGVASDVDHRFYDLDQLFGFSQPMCLLPEAGLLVADDDACRAVVLVLDVMPRRVKKALMTNVFPLRTSVYARASVSQLEARRTGAKGADFLIK
jgi:hypothetical protein